MQVLTHLDVKKNNWEGGWRPPSMVRSPGQIEAGSASNEIMQGMDWFTTYLAAAENTDIKENLLKGATENGRSYKVYLDGYKMLPFLTGKEKKGALK